MKPTNQNYTITLILLLCATAVFSQPAEQWVARYNSGNTDQLYAITVDTDGNVYATGASVQVPFTSDYLTVKYNSSGVKLWEKTYNSISGSDDRAYAITVDVAGNVYVTGGTAYDNSMVTIKYNSTGDSIWTRSYTGPTSGHNWTFAKNIFVDDTGNVFIAGTSEGLSAVHGLRQDYTTIKYNSLGIEQWTARYNGPGTDADIINSMAVDGTGNVYVTGFSGGGSTGSADSYNDITTIKYNFLGDTVWTKTYKGSSTSSDVANKIALDNSGNVYITGTTYIDTSVDENIVTIKYNQAGAELWKKFFNGTGNNTDEGKSMVVDAEQNVFVTGKSYYGSSNGFDIVTIKYDSIGTELWAENYNGSANGADAGVGVAVDEDGNIYVAGTTTNTTTAEDFQVIKYSAAGTKLWDKKYTYLNAAGSQENTAAFFVDGDKNIYIAGMSALDYAVVKYAETSTSVVEVEKSIDDFIIYPNPASNRIWVKVSGMNSEQVNIYNANGSLVRQCNSIDNKGIDVSQLANGIYLVCVNGVLKKLVKM